MSNYEEITKDILIKAMEHGYVAKYSSTYTTDADTKNIESIQNAFKEIYKAVANPID